MKNKEEEQPESLKAFHDRQNSGEGDGSTVIITNPGMTREEAIKHLGLSSDPAKDSLQHVLTKLTDGRWTDGK